MQTLSSFTTILCCIILLSGTAYSQSPLILTGNPEAPPISWAKEKTSLQGVGVDLAVNILNQLSVDYILTNSGNWSDVQEKLQQGKADMVVSAYKNKEREKYLNFSVPYLQSPVVIVVKKGEQFLCNCWEDLVGKKGVAGIGESFGEKFDDYISNKLEVTYTSYERAFTMLEEDQADYLIIDLYPALIYSKLLLVEDKIDFMNKPATTQQFHMALSKKSPYLSLLPEINAKLKELKKSGKIEKLAVRQYQQWHKTFKERQNFFARSKQKAAEAQSKFDAKARDRGLDNLAKFYEREVIYMDGAANLSQ